MPVNNRDIVRVFSKIADLLEIKDANPFRVRAYREAAHTINGLSESVARLIEEGEDLSGLPGIGKDLAGKIKTIVKTGSHPLLKDLKQEVPGELSDLMKIKGIGPRKVSSLYEELEIKNRRQLEKAAEKHRIRELEGFGPKTERNILEQIKRREKEHERLKRADAEKIIEPFIRYLRKEGKLESLQIAGSFRRKKETVGDVDILAAGHRGCQIMDRFTGYEDVKEVLSSGDTRSSVILKSGLQVDLRVVPQAGFGAALHYFTGSQAHTVAIRKIAVKKNYKLNEYGGYRKNKRVFGRTEREVYDKLGMNYIEPELRENRGEIDAARTDNLPDLVKVDDIRGDLHVHTDATDGRHSMEDMVKAARKKGYKYVAISDHSRNVTVAGGLGPKELEEQLDRIDRLQERTDGIRILKSAEVDILEDGTLDLPDGILKKLDFTICSVHYHFDLSRKKQTERVLKAMDNRYMNILGHASGRLIHKRPPMELDMEKLMKAAADRRIHFEINSHPDRLDLNDRHCRMGKELGIKMAVTTDAHITGSLDLMRFGVDQARRGWLEAEDIINTRPWKNLKSQFER